VTRRGPLARESLALGMLETSSPPDRLAWLAQVVPSLEASGVIYVRTVADTTRVASFLRTHGIDAHAYSGETEPERRLELEDALIANEVKALVATSALGSWPPRPSGWDFGRAGRAPAGHGDRDIQDSFIGSAFPSRAKAEDAIAKW